MYKNMLKSSSSSKRNLEKNRFGEYNKKSKQNDVNSIFLNIIKEHWRLILSDYTLLTIIIKRKVL